MKVAFFELEGWEKEMITRYLPGCELYLTEKPLREDMLPEENDAEAISVFISSQINAVVLDCFPRLRCIATRSTGYDHIDVAECKKRGITVVYVPGYGDNTVAEFAFGLLLNLIRKIYAAIDQVKEQRSFALAGLRGMDLKDKNIGIIGTGRIGTEMIKMAGGFSMRVLAYDLFPKAELAKELGFSYVSLEELLTRSDFISLHCPYNEKTHHLINNETIKFIKRGAYIINTARGGIIETQALITALMTGIVAGAGLDVLEEEGDLKDELHLLAYGHPKEQELRVLLANNALINMPNVLITPHTAFNTDEAVRRILATTLDNLKGFEEGKPGNVVP